MVQGKLLKLGEKSKSRCMIRQVSILIYHSQFLLPCDMPVTLVTIFVNIGGGELRYHVGVFTFI